MVYTRHPGQYIIRRHRNKRLTYGSTSDNRLHRLDTRPNRRNYHNWMVHNTILSVMVYSRHRFHVQNEHHNRCNSHFIMAGRKFHDLRHHGKNCRYAIHTICLYHTFSPFVRYPRLDSHTFMVSSPTGRKRTFGRGKLSHPRTRRDIHRRTSTR